MKSTLPYRDLSYDLIDFPITTNDILENKKWRLEHYFANYFMLGIHELAYQDFQHAGIQLLILKE